MANECEVMEFLQVFAQLIKCTVKRVVDYVFRRRQPWTGQLATTFNK